MRSEEFISSLSAMSKEYDRFEKIRRDIPLGEDSAGNVLYARKHHAQSFARHTCVTGGGKSGFLRRLLITVSCLYERSDICFFVLSPFAEYGELLRMRSMDITTPYIRNKADLTLAVATLEELLNMRSGKKGFPRLFVIADGLETLPDCNQNGDLEEYRAIIDLFSHKEGVDILTGVDLTKSIFSGYPGAFVGVGNCLVATREVGKADVTYVQEDVSLSLPMPITYPSEPAIMETILFLNSVSKENE